MSNVIIFDIDGVLVDSEAAITTACMQALHENGIPAKFDDFKAFTGMGDDKFIAGVAGLYGYAVGPEIKNRAYQIYLETASEQVHVFDWTRPLLEHLAEKGYMLVAASSADREKVLCNLSCIGADSALFRTVITGSEVQKKKPAPDIFVKALSEVGGDPFHCIVAEDAVSGILAAKAAGVVAVGVTTSFRADALYEAGADFTVDDLMSLEQIAESVFSMNHG